MTLRLWAGVAALFVVMVAPAAQSSVFGGGNALLNAIQDGTPGDVHDVVLTGETVHVKNTDGTPAIVMAAQRRNSQIVKILLEAGARPNDAARNGETALLVAAGNGDDEIVVQLLAAKADPDKPGALRETPLLRAVRGRHAAIVKLLIESKADIELTDSSGTAALDLAESLHDAQISGLLRKAGAQ